MPFSISPALAALAFAILATIAAMFAALLGWLLLAIRGEKVLPEVLPLQWTAPWGWVTVGATVVFYFIVLNLVVVYGYALAREHLGVRIGSPASAKIVAKNLVVQPEKPSRPQKDLKSPPRLPLVEPSLEPPISIPDEGRKGLNFTETMALVSVVNSVFILFLPLILRPTTSRPWLDLGLTSNGWIRDVGLGLGGFLVATPLVILINFLATRIWASNRHPLEAMLREGLSPGGIVLAYLSAVVLAPIAEEMMFRGVIQGWLVRLGASLSGPSESPAEDLALADLPPPIRSPFLPRIPSLPGFGPTSKSRRSSIPILVTSFFFGLVHFQQMPAPIAIFFLSLALGWLREATGSLLPSIVLHAAFNGFNTTLMVFAISLLGTAHDHKKSVAPTPPAHAGNRVIPHTFRLALDVTTDRFVNDSRGSWRRPVPSR